MQFHIVSLALLGFGCTTHTHVLRSCAGDICFGLNIPENTALLGNGDIYIQIIAPTTYSWVGLGRGSAMSGSHMFVIYTSADGNNVTISPRLGVDYTMPQFTADTHVALLEGSGVSNGQMVANARCSNCQSWPGGSMDFTSAFATWIHASRSGMPLNSDDQSETIVPHGPSYGSFNWDFGTAKGGSSVNPFATSSSMATGAGSTHTCVPMPSAKRAVIPSTYTGSKYVADSEVNYCEAGDSSSNSSGSATQNRGAANWEYASNMLIAHGVLASLAFVILFPGGAISIRLFSFPGLLWFHAVVQVLAYLVVGSITCFKVSLLSHHIA